MCTLLVFIYTAVAINNTGGDGKNHCFVKTISMIPLMMPLFLLVSDLKCVVCRFACF